MNKNRKQQVALTRYGAIAPLITGAAGEGVSNAAFFREVSEKGITMPDGTTRHFSPPTISRWYHLYVNRGFEALMPADRGDMGKSRKIDDELAGEIRRMKKDYPRLSAAEIFRQLKDRGSVGRGQLSESTVLRFLNRMADEEKAAPGDEMRRYERAHINEVWCGDSSAGPYLVGGDGKKHRTFIIALIDDASRFVTGAGVFFNDTFVNLMSVMKSAVSKYGRPKVFNFDNGSAYRNRQMDLLAARIGTELRYCHPYSPTQKAKIERWFRTLKDHWMASLDMRDYGSLDGLGGSLQGYLGKYNRTPHSSLGGGTPQERFFSEPELISRLPEGTVDGSFLLETERRVSPDCVISVDNTEYEVDHRFAGRRVTIRHTPDMGEMFAGEADGTLTPIRVLNKTENALARREKTRLTEGGD